MQIGSLECILLLAGWCDRFASSVVIRKMRAGISPMQRPSDRYSLRSDSSLVATTRIEPNQSSSA
jgi:hypothetical protein